MILWSALFGALVGWGFAEFEEYGFILGGIAGAIFGWGARKAIRHEIDAATAALRAEIALLAARGDTPEDDADHVRPTPVTPIVTVPATRPAPARIVTGAAPIGEAPPYEPAPVAPAQPGLIQTAVADAIAAAKGWLLGGNTIVRAGLVILFVGLSFLASYAASAGLFPIELRLATVAAIGLALLVVGFRTRIVRPGFGLALQGGGIAIIYLTLFAAAKLYDTVGVSPAFALMIVVCALGCALALLQRSQALAVTSFAGGFATPLLLSDGTGNVAGLFAFFTILNLAILFIATRQSWRMLNLIGFIATFGVMALWEAASYRPADYAVAQAFLIVSVLVYVVSAVLFTRGTPGRFGGVVDTTLLFGPALAGFGLQIGLVNDRPFGTAFAALGFAALYLGVAVVTSRQRRDRFRVMNETLLAIGIGFVTLAIPLALGARWTSAAWALEGVGAFWVGMRQARWMPRLFGLILQAVAALIYLASQGPNVAPLPFANAGFMGAMLIALAGLATAWWLRVPLPYSGSRPAQAYAAGEALLGRPAFLFGFGFWWIAFVAEAMRLLPPIERGTLPAAVFAAGTQVLLIMLAYVASAWGAQAIGRRMRWPVARWPSLATMPVMVLALIAAVDAGARVLDWPAGAIWIAAIGLHLHALYRNDRDAADDAPARVFLRFGHAGGVWVGTALIADGLLLAIDRAHLWYASWGEAALLLALAGILAGLTIWAGRALGTPGDRRWPLDDHAVDYAWIAALPLTGLLAIATLLVALLSSGAADPLPYLPLLNPADVTLALALVTLALWRQTIIGAAPPGASIVAGQGARVMLAVLAFVVLNTAWLRVAHHLLGVGWSADALLGSAIVQTGFAILWTLLALALMVIAHRRAGRGLWLVGAGLLGLTVAKLLLVDLNTVGGGARIVAFIGVGVLMLVVGYLAPLPPRTAPDAAAEAA